MFQFHKRVLGLSVGLVMLTLLILGSTATAFADGGPVTATADLGGGALSATATVVNTTGFVLSGADQTYSYTLPVAMTDATGSNLGWNLTISSSQFTSGPDTLSTNASSITAVAITDGTGIAPTASTLSHDYTSPLPINATAAKFFSATAGTGTGSSTITPTIDVAVPAGTTAGSYTSTITVASVSAP